MSWRVHGILPAAVSLRMRQRAWASASVLAAGALWAGAAAPADLVAWLDAAPSIKQHIVWISGSGKREPFDAWTPAQQERLTGFYRALVHGDRQLKIHLPKLSRIDPHNGRAYFTAEEAFDVYAAHVAHVLFVEAGQRVPWSIATRPGAELDELLGGGAYVARIAHSTGNTYPEGIVPGRDFAETAANNALGELNGDPRIGYDFASGKTSLSHRRLIGADEWETLQNLTLWLRDNVGHGPIDDLMIERAKKFRWLDDRLRATPGLNYIQVPCGCHSSSKLMVDLARSVNIPLLHTRAFDNTLSADTACHFLNRTHGGLLYGWGGAHARLLWHSDEVCANNGRICFPLDPKTGDLAVPELAAKMYCDEYWATPAQLKRAGFLFRRQFVLPGRGPGVATRGSYEDRADFGWLCGQWERQGASKLDDIYLLNHDYALCGAPLLQMALHNITTAQVRSDLESWRGAFALAALPHVLAPEDYARRAAAAVKALGGSERTARLIEQAKKNMGRDVLPPRRAAPSE